jgi:hypothetical protein
MATSRNMFDCVYYSAKHDDVKVLFVSLCWYDHSIYSLCIVVDLCCVYAIV